MLDIQLPESMSQPDVLDKFLENKNNNKRSELENDVKNNDLKESGQMRVILEFPVETAETGQEKSIENDDYKVAKKILARMLEERIENFMIKFEKEKKII